MAFNSSKIGSILQNFVSGTPDIQGAALVSPDGLPLAATLYQYEMKVSKIGGEIVKELPDRGKTTQTGDNGDSRVFGKEP
jgi:hypothetical protein